MSAAPAFQFYPNDFLAGTTFLSAAAVGSYMRMLANSWNHGPIPNTPDALYKAMGLAPTDPPFSDVWSELQHKWVLTTHGWINRKLEKVRANQAAFSKVQSRKGQLSGRARRNKTHEPRLNPGSTPARTHDEPKTNSLSLISDLDLRSQTHAQTNPPAPTWRAASQRQSQSTALINGREIRKHGEHAFCDRKCVPYTLHADFIRALGKPETEGDTWLQAFYRRTMVKYEGQPIGDDLFDFWRHEFAGAVGTVTAKSTTVKGRGDASRDAMARVLAKRASKVLP